MAMTDRTAFSGADPNPALRTATVSRRGGGILARAGLARAGLARASLVIAAWLVGLHCPTALANRLQVGPTLIEMAAGRQAEAVWLTNAGATPMAVQIRVFRWDQDPQGEQLSPTTDLIVSPTQTTIQAGQRQLVRILRRAATTEVEQSFRIIVDELSGGTAEPGRPSGLQFRLRYSIPVFVAAATEGARPASGSSPMSPITGTAAGSAASPTRAASPASSAAAEPPVLDVTLETGGASGQSGVLVVTNPGPRRAQLAEASLELPGREPVLLSPGLLGYVLPGRTMRWIVRDPSLATISAAEFKARVNAGARFHSFPVRVRLPY